MKVIRQRIFIEQGEQPYWLNGVILEELGQEGQIVLTGHLPGGLDLTSPQTLCLVFQKVADPQTFFDMQCHGMIMVFGNFRITGSMPIVLLKNRATGEVTVPTPEFECVYETIHQWVVTNDSIHVTTLER